MNRIVEKAPRPAHEYLQAMTTRPSRLIPGERIANEDRYRCPRCNSKGVGELPHGEEKQCPGCDLWITRYGNALEIANAPVGPPEDE